MESLESKSISPLFLLLEFYNVLRYIGKPYVKSLDSQSDLRPDPPLWVKLGKILENT